jgi:hypothetical protein
MHGAVFTGPCVPHNSIWQCPLRRENGESAVLAWTTQWGTTERAELGMTFRYAHTIDGSTAELKTGEKPLLEGRPRLFNNER